MAWTMSWQANDFSQREGSWMSKKIELEGYPSLVFEESPDKVSDLTEVEPEPIPLTESEAGLKELNRSAESMLPAGLLDDITGDLHQESVNHSVWCSEGPQPYQPVKTVDVSTTVSMLASVLGKNTALHYEADGQKISTTGGNDFVAAQFSPESCQLATSPAASAAAPHKTAVQETSDPVGFNYYTAQHGDCVQYQGAACPKPSGLFGGGAWSANAVGGQAPAMLGRFCVFCGKPKHSLNQRFCSHCGSPVVA